MVADGVRTGWPVGGRYGHRQCMASAPGGRLCSGATVRFHGIGGAFDRRLRRAAEPRSVCSDDPRRRTRTRACPGYRSNTVVVRTLDHIHQISSRARLWRRRVCIVLAGAACRAAPTIIDRSWRIVRAENGSWTRPPAALWLKAPARPASTRRPRSLHRRRREPEVRRQRSTTPAGRPARGSGGHRARTGHSPSAMISRLEAYDDRTSHGQ